MEAKTEPLTTTPTSARIKAKAMRTYVRVTAWLFVVTGLGLLYTGAGREPFLDQTDVVLGFTTRAVLLATAAILVALAGYLFFGLDLIIQGMLILWIALVLFSYRMGLVWMKAPAPYPVIVLPGWRLGIDPVLLDVYWRMLMVYLGAGGMFIVGIDWFDRRRARAAAWKKLCLERGWKL